MTYSFFDHIFQYEKFPVEKVCFEQALLTDNINYIAVPWTQILNSHWLDFPGKLPKEEYLKTLSRAKIEQKNNITVCQHDSYLLLENYYNHFNITKVFACAAYTYDNINGIDIIPMPYINTFNFHIQEKDILVSFIGSITDKCRYKIKTNIKNDYIIFRDTYHITSNFFAGDSKLEEEKEYKDILSRSRFSLCPRGSNPNSVRFWESLAAGAIPILISDHYKLPKWNWDNTIIKIAESELDTLDYKKLTELLNIPNEDEMRNNCLLAYNKFCADNYIKYITSYL